MTQTRLEKLLKKQNLDEDAIKAISDRIESVFAVFMAQVNDKRVASKNDLDDCIQNIQDMDADEFVQRMSQDFNALDECDESEAMLDRITAYIFEEIAIRKKCKGFSNNIN